MKNKCYIIICILFIFTISFMTIGYSAFDKLISLKGIVTILSYGNVKITNLELVESSNVSNHTENYNDLDVDLSITFDGEDTNYYAKYYVTIENDSYKDFEFVMFNLNTEIDTNEGTLSYELIDIANGDTIASRSLASFYVVLYLNTDTPGTYDVNTSGSVEATSNTTGNILAAIPDGTTGNLVTNTKVPVEISVISTYSYDRDFKITLNNSNFKLVDAAGNDLSSMTISANDTLDTTIYIALNDGYTFANDTESISLSFVCNGISTINMGSVTLTVPINVVTDNEPPVISNVVITQNTAVGSATLSFNGADASSIKNYTIVAYKDGSLFNTYNTTSDENYYNFSNLSKGTYYFIVYGTDEVGNTASSSDISNATTSSGYASKSSELAMQWTFEVTSSLSNLSLTGNSTVNIGETYTGTLKSTNSQYTLPDSITVTMGGNTLSTDSYTYNNNTGVVTVPNVSGDIKVTASGVWCLIEGTKVLLATGEYKNIENISYDDLLKVWSYETGSYTYLYPIWIEKTGTTNYFTRISFTDGTYLDTLGAHGVFSLDDNLFVSTIDYDNFKVGTNIAKISNEGIIYNVTVTKIENINKKVNYYHVVSERYYNIIANNVLTTDDFVILSNLYGFNDNITWKNKPTTDKYDYSLFSDIMDYSLFNGLRAGEAKLLVDNGYFTLDEFREYLLNNQLNPNMYVKQDNYYNVTYDIDGVMTTIKYNNSDLKLLKPYVKGKKFVCWYNSLDDKCYNDNIKLTNSIYLKAIFK